MNRLPDPPELQKAIDLIREIYWNEYSRGYMDAKKRVLDVCESIRDNGGGSPEPASLTAHVGTSDPESGRGQPGLRRAVESHTDT